MQSPGTPTTSVKVRFHDVIGAGALALVLQPQLDELLDGDVEVSWNPRTIVVAVRRDEQIAPAVLAADVLRAFTDTPADTPAGELRAQRMTLEAYDPDCYDADRC